MTYLASAVVGGRGRGRGNRISETAVAPGRAPGTIAMNVADTGRGGATAASTGSTPGRTTQRATATQGGRRAARRAPLPLRQTLPDASSEMVVLPPDVALPTYDNCESYVGP